MVQKKKATAAAPTVPITLVAYDVRSDDAPPIVVEDPNVGAQWVYNARVADCQQRQPIVNLDVST